MNEEDDIKTVLIQKLKWLPPVASLADLPGEGVEEGTHCFVEGPETEGEEQIWQFTGGAWVQIDDL